jgi:hypothetical protein
MTMLKIEKSKIVPTFWRFTVIFLGAICFLVSAQHVNAETVKFRIVNYISKLEIILIEDVEGHMIGVYQRRGLALFENGDVATEISCATFDGIKGKGTFQGYSILTYEDGSTTVSKYKGNMWRTQDGKFRLENGTGEYIGGTKYFEGIKGTLSWTGKRFTPYSKDVGADNLLDVTAIYTLPSR